MKKLVVLLLLTIVVKLGAAQSAKSITGTWWNEEKTSKIEVVEKNGTYVGTITYLIPEKYENGKAPKDVHNPEEAKRSRSLIGIEILSGLKYVAADKEWQDGLIYDPKSGKSYDCYGWFEGDTNKLYLKGYVVGLKWLGKSTVWTRIN